MGRVGRDEGIMSPTATRGARGTAGGRAHGRLAYAGDSVLLRCREHLTHKERSAAIAPTRTSASVGVEGMGSFDVMPHRRALRATGNGSVQSVKTRPPTSDSPPLAPLPHEAPEARHVSWTSG